MACTDNDCTEHSPTGFGDEPTSLSPVYSLAVHHQSLWLLSGTESGTINLQSVRHDEGKRITCLRKHTSAVSVLNLARDETSVLSGSWDKAIIDWDLNTGDIKRVFESGTGGQISTIEPRPHSSLPVPDDSTFVPLSNGIFSSNNDAKPLPNGIVTNGVRNTAAGGSGATANGTEDAAGSPHNSLFEDNDSHGSLFGDEEGGTGGDAIPQLGGDEDNEFSRAIADSIQQQQEADTEPDAEMTDIGGPVQPPAPVPEQDPTITAPTESAQLESLVNGVTDAQSAPVTNGLTHSVQSTTAAGASQSAAGADGADTPVTSDTTFLDASFDGTLRVWDRRQPNPVARIFPSKSIPPWCMGACWSPDGNFIYAGRRNGAVDEYSLHRGLREPIRTLRFPSVSGPVTAVRAMPNGRHLVWYACSSFCNLSGQMLTLTSASYDILRLYDLKEQSTTRSAVPYLIVPGHRTGVISQLYIDPSCTFMISTGGNRGWEGASTEVLLGYEIGIER